MPGDEEQVTGAAALLARLRSSAGRRASGGTAPSGPDPTAAAPKPRDETVARTAPPPERSTAPPPSRPSAPPAASGRRTARHSSRDLDNDERVAFEIHVEGLKPRRTKLRLGDPLA